VPNAERLQLFEESIVTALVEAVDTHATNIPFLQITQDRLDTLSDRAYTGIPGNSNHPVAIHPRQSRHHTNTLPNNAVRILPLGRLYWSVGAILYFCPIFLHQGIDEEQADEFSGDDEGQGRGGLGRRRPSDLGF